MTKPDPDRHDINIQHEGHTFRVSFLHMFQRIIYTRMDGKRAGEIVLDRPFASRTPNSMLLINEIINHMDHQDSDTRKEQWPTQYA